jgi:hypothetical protein
MCPPTLPAYPVPSRPERDVLCSNVVGGDFLNVFKRITPVYPAASVQTPQGVQVIGLSRATALPGLLDRHVYLMRTRRHSPPCRTWIALHLRHYPRGADASLRMYERKTTPARQRMKCSIGLLRVCGGSAFLERRGWKGPTTDVLCDSLGTAVSGVPA